MISLYSRTCNTPGYMLDLFVEHYRPHVQRITLFDDGSDAEFRALLEPHRRAGRVGHIVDVRRDARDPEERMRPAMKVLWQNDPAEVVVCVDIDELLFPPERLANAIAIHRPVGYEVYGIDNAYEVPQGRQLMRYDPYDKPCIIGPVDRPTVEHVPGWHRLQGIHSAAHCPMVLLNMRFINLRALSETLVGFRLPPEKLAGQMERDLLRYVSGLFNHTKITLAEALEHASGNRWDA